MTGIILPWYVHQFNHYYLIRVYKFTKFKFCWSCIKVCCTDLKQHNHWSSSFQPHIRGLEQQWSASSVVFSQVLSGVRRLCSSSVPGGRSLLLLLPPRDCQRQATCRGGVWGRGWHCGGCYVRGAAWQVSDRGAEERRMLQWWWR